MTVLNATNSKRTFARHFGEMVPSLMAVSTR